MMKQEFEKIAGYEVSVEDYDMIIEPMYMATDLSKEEFVKAIDKKRFALPTKREMVRKMKKMAQFLADNCGRRSYWEEKQDLDRMAKEYAKRFYGIDWNKDTDSYVYFTTGYEFPSVKRGCTYPMEMVIGRGYSEFERILLVKE